MANMAYRWAELKMQARQWVAQGANDLYNRIVPAFSNHVHYYDNSDLAPATPVEAEAKPSFEESMASQKPPAMAPAPAADKGMEL